MAVDTVAGTPGAGAAFVFDLVSGSYWPVTKLTFGADDAAGTFVSATEPLPVLLRGPSGAAVTFAEDAVHGSGDLGIMPLGVRKDTAAALAGADGDYQPFIFDANGRLHVLDQNSAAALTALQLIDDPVFADDAAFTIGTSKVHMLGATVDEAATDSADEGDAVAIRATANRVLRVVPSLHDGTTEGADSMRSNGAVTLLTSAARTASTSSATQTNHNFRGVYLILNVTVAGTGTLRLYVRMVDPASGATVTVTADSAGITTTGTYWLTLHPGALASTVAATAPPFASGLNAAFAVQAANALLPRSWVGFVSHSDGSSWTYTLGAFLIV